MLRAIIFDIGGVLACDVWEPLFLDEKNGLCTKLGLSHDVLRDMGKKLWNKYANLSGDASKLEFEYWRDFIHLTEVNVQPSDLIAYSENFIRPIEPTVNLVKELYDRYHLCICSNNTEFWYRRQYHALDLGKYFDNDDIFLSCRVGVPKTDSEYRMFELIANRIRIPRNECLLIDDRPCSIEHAEAFGFQNLLFSSDAAEGVARIKSFLAKNTI